LNRIPIIAISATKLSQKESEAAGYFDVFLTKPINIRVLTSHLKKYLPHTNKSEKYASPKRPVKFLNTMASEDKERIKTEIESLLNDCYVILESSSFDEIHEFAKRIEKLSSTFHISVLEQSANNIIQASKNFDIEGITEHITTLPQLFNTLLDEINK